MDASHPIFAVLYDWLTWPAKRWAGDRWVRGTARPE